MMNLSRRGFIGSMLAFGVAPAIVRASSIMPIKVSSGIDARWAWNSGDHINCWAEHINPSLTEFMRNSWDNAAFNTLVGNTYGP